MFVSIKSHKSWTTKKIALLSILISTSVGFIVVSADLFPFTALPSFKLTIGGLPIKITGFIFGPLLGSITGVMADLISFMFRPTFLSFWHTASFLITGFLPGLIGAIYKKHWLNQKDLEKTHEEKYDKFNFFLTIGLIIFSLFIFIVFFIAKGDIIENSEKLFGLKNKWIFLVFSIFGLVSMLIAMMFFRFILSPKVFNNVIAIIAFSTLLEIYATPMVSIGDFKIFTNEKYFNMDTIFSTFFINQLITPAKIWFNLFVIYYSYKIISPIIKNKESSSW